MNDRPLIIMLLTISFSQGHFDSRNFGLPLCELVEDHDGLVELSLPHQGLRVGEVVF
jgi:hypothetical protein